MHRIRLALLPLAAALGLLGTAVLGAPASAQSDPAAAADTIIVSPPVDEQNANPGQVVTRKVTITNSTNRTREFTTKAQNAVPQGNEGTPNLVPDEGPYALASWIKVTPAKATIESGKSLAFDVTVSVPNDAGPGSHSGAVVFTPGAAATGDGAAVSVVAEVSSLLLVNVSGDARADIKLTSFAAEKTFYQSGPVKFTALFKNEGNLVSRPQGTVVVKNIFGKTVATLPVEGARVLPTAERKFEATWSPKGLFGPYTAEFSWNAGQDSATPSKVRFWGAPLKVIIPVVLGAVLVFLLLWLPRKRLKKAFAALRAPVD